MERMDSRTKYPSSMEEYLEDYGFHFNKRLFDFAVSMMEDRSGKKLSPWSKEQCESFLKDQGVTINRRYGHDIAYAVNMARADYLGSSIPDERHLAFFAKDYIDDRDGAGTRAFDEFYAKTVALGIPIFWDEML